MDSMDRYGDGSSADRGAHSDTGPLAHSDTGPLAGPPGDPLALRESLLRSLDSVEDLARWRDEVISLHRHMVSGASAAPDPAGRPRDPAGRPRDPAGRPRGGDGSRTAHPVAISTLEALLAAGIDRMRKNGELTADADPARLATGLAAALQGGSLLARTTRSTAPLEAALDLALSHVRSHSAR